MKSLVARIGQFVRRSAEKEDDQFDARLKSLAAPAPSRRSIPAQPSPVLFRRNIAAA